MELDSRRVQAKKPAKASGARARGLRSRGPGLGPRRGLRLRGGRRHAARRVAAALVRAPPLVADAARGADVDAAPAVLALEALPAALSRGLHHGQQVLEAVLRALAARPCAGASASTGCLRCDSNRLPVCRSATLRESVRVSKNPRPQSSKGCPRILQLPRQSSGIDGAHWKSECPKRTGPARLRQGRLHRHPALRVAEALPAGLVAKQHRLGGCREGLPRTLSYT